MSELQECITNFEDDLGGQPRWALLSFFNMGIGLVTYGLEYNKISNSHNLMVHRLNDLIDDYKQINADYTASGTINAFLNGDVFYYYKCNKIRKVLKMLRGLRKEIKKIESELCGL